MARVASTYEVFRKGHLKLVKYTRYRICSRLMQERFQARHTAEMLSNLMMLKEDEKGGAHFKI